MKAKTNKELTFDDLYLPAPLNLLNSIARLSGNRLTKRISLCPDELMESAKRRSKLSDWGPPDIQPALSRLCSALDREGKLSFFGKLAMQRFIIDNLSNRLRVIDAVKKYPEIQHIKIEKPIFITGWYRTGTTFLHNLIAQANDIRTPLFWELLHPWAGSSTADIDKIIRKTQRKYSIHRYIAPNFDTAHPMDPEKPEECLHLFENNCAGTMGFFLTEAQSIAWSFLEEDMLPAYQFYKTQLQLMHWQRPGGRWAFKWPYHLWHLDTLMATFPDAHIVQLHRHPIEAIPSVCSLSALAKSSFCDSIDKAAMGKFWIDYCEAGIERGLEMRKKISPAQITDINYRQLINDPAAVLEKIMQDTKLSIDDDVLNRIKPTDRQKSSQKSHQYSKTQFKLDDAEIQERFAYYIQRFSL